MPLCSYCDNINIQELMGCTGYDHQPSWSSLVRSAQTCKLCRLIRDESSHHHYPDTEHGRVIMSGWGEMNLENRSGSYLELIDIKVGPVSPFLCSLEILAYPG
jgi:hypothetical protein